MTPPELERLLQAAHAHELLLTYLTQGVNPPVEIRCGNEKAAVAMKRCLNELRESLAPYRIELVRRN